MVTIRTPAFDKELKFRDSYTTSNKIKLLTYKIFLFAPETTVPNLEM